MGYLKERIEGLVLAYQYCLVARNSLKKLKHTSIVQNNDGMRNEISKQRNVVLIRVEELATTLDTKDNAARETQS